MKRSRSNTNDIESSEPRYIHLMTADDGGCLHKRHINISAFDNGQKLEEFFDMVAAREDKKIKGDRNSYKVYLPMTYSANYLELVIELATMKESDELFYEGTKETLEELKKDIKGLTDFEFPFHWSAAEWGAAATTTSSGNGKMRTTGTHYEYTSWW